MNTPPTIFIVDDDADVRDFLNTLLQSSGYQVQTYERAQTFMESYRVDQPGCLLLDVRMPELSGPGLQDKLLEKGICLPIIMMTGYGDVSTAVKAMKKGAVDFIEKPIDAPLLLQRVEEALEKGTIDRKINKRKEELLTLFARLTTREREVMELVVTGKANKQVASDLGISPKTVEIHRAHVMQKIQVKSLAELVRAAYLSESVSDQ